MSSTPFKSTLIRHQSMVKGLFRLDVQVNNLLKKIIKCLDQGNKIIFFGNGGSAADAQHLAAEFIVRYQKQRSPLAAMALTTDTSIITAHGNDYSFSTIFDRQILALAKKGDIAIGLSASGNSDNVMNGIKKAQQIGCWTCAFTGASGGKLFNLADDCIRLSTEEIARVQEGHIIVGHWLCEALDDRMSRAQ